MRRLLAAILCLGGPAMAQGLPPIQIGAGYLSRCNPPSALTQTVTCTVYLDGVVSGIRALQANMVGGPICFPLNATLHDIDAKFVEYLRAAPPALLSNPTPDLLVTMMKAAWPCQR